MRETAALVIWSYRYGFQGQEEDGEIWGGAVSFKYRVEDSRLGRFFSVDPLRSEYPELTTYAFSGNRLIDCIDLEGLEPTQTIFDEGNMRVKSVQLANDANQHLSPSQDLHPNSDLSLKLEAFDKYRSIVGEERAEYYSKPFLKVLPDNLMHRGKPIPLFSNYGLQGSVVEGELLGEHGWNKGGKQLFFGTIGAILSGGTLAAGGLSLGAASLEGMSLTLSVDDISAGFFRDGQSSMLIEAGISASTLNKLKFVNDTRAFVSGLRSIIRESINDPSMKIKMSDQTWDRLNLANDELMLLENGMEAASDKD